MNISPFGHNSWEVKPAFPSLNLGVIGQPQLPQNPFIQNIVEAKQQTLFAYLRRNYAQNPLGMVRHIQSLQPKYLCDVDGTVSQLEIDAQVQFNMWLNSLKSDAENMLNYFHRMQAASQQAILRTGVVIFPDRPSLFVKFPPDILDLFINPITPQSAPQVIIREVIKTETIIKEEKTTELLLVNVPVPYGTYEGKFQYFLRHKPLAIAFKRLMNNIANIDSAITSPLALVTMLEHSGMMVIDKEFESLRVTIKNLSNISQGIEDGEDTVLNQALQQFVEENYPKIKAASLDKGKKIT
jgi:hypothetical protein